MKYLSTALLITACLYAVPAKAGKQRNNQISYAKITDYEKRQEEAEQKILALKELIFQDIRSLHKAANQAALNTVESDLDTKILKDFAECLEAEKRCNHMIQLEQLSAGVEELSLLESTLKEELSQKEEGLKERNIFCAKRRGSLRRHLEEKAKLAQELEDKTKLFTSKQDEFTALEGKIAQDQEDILATQKRLKKTLDDLSQIKQAHVKFIQEHTELRPPLDETISQGQEESLKIQELLKEALEDSPQTQTPVPAIPDDAEDMLDRKEVPSTQELDQSAQASLWNLYGLLKN